MLPDNCLFADQAGEVFEILMRGLRPAHGPAPAARHVHALQPGRKANVVFFTKGGPPRPCGSTTPAPTSRGITKKDRPLDARALRRVREVLRRRPERPAKRKPADSKEDRWRSFTIDEVKRARLQARRLQVAQGRIARRPDDLPEPEELATDAIAELEAAVEELNAVISALENGNGDGKGNGHE